jgi:uncharacterized protein
MVLENDVFENENCTGCSFLPICSGGCPYSRIHGIDTEENQYRCTIFKNHLKEIMNLYYECYQDLVSTSAIN